MRIFDYCTNCREYTEFCEIDDVKLCSCCGEPLEENIDEDLTYNMDDYEEDDNGDI